MDHLGEQFADLLGQVNERFDIDYGDNPALARVGGLHLPVSRGTLFLDPHGRGNEGMTLNIPNETGSSSLYLRPATGVAHAQNYGEGGRLAFAEDGDLSEIVGRVLTQRTESPHQWHPQMLKRDAEDTDSGKYVVGLERAGQAHGWRFDPRTGRVVGPVPGE